MSGQPDVWWDWQASDAAIAALRRVAAAVDAEQRQRSRAATELLADWRGPRQDEWALRQAALQITAVQLRDRCLQAAQAIAQASERARAEQARINRERAALQQVASYGGQ
ncbi:hypothetical protein [Chloroflexus sp. Y-396-1]|uniref:hypothetical protein n=1 Tax=Chloroflexus sp. Y-396-1 TaxID=867845 RepID=UPI000490BD75|nr:hypothetical protein [Chloroflexus sp. Y-396-1]